MKVLVVGSGGREHALVWKIARSEQVSEILCAPGNAGTASIARNVPIEAGEVDKLVSLARHEGVGLVVVGPEDPLCAGIADKLREAGIPTFGPGASGARLEGSKVFSKEFLERHRIPTGAYRRFTRSGEAKTYLDTVKTWPQVIKADGLAAGKGVFIVHDADKGARVIDSIMEKRTLGDAGNVIVIEEFLHGRELSVHVITDGSTLLILESVQDYKQVGEDDTGPNTGGMGVYSPVPFVTQRLMRQIEQRVLIPTLHALSVEGIEFRGTLFAGLMIQEGGPKVLEYNCRFGDPETQAIVRRMESDLVPYLLAAAEGRLDEMDPPEWSPKSCVGVVAAAEGYPNSYLKGDVISGLTSAGETDETVIFHGGTRPDGTQILTNGGRVLCVTSLGDPLDSARERAYAAYERIQWSGKFCRPDIARPGRGAADEVESLVV